jgi:hypothetical protein
MPGERPALRVDKLRLRGLEAPFSCSPFDATDVYLNTLRGELTYLSAPLRKRKLGRNILSD